MRWEPEHVKEHEYQRIHEELLDELNVLVGVRVRNFEEDTVHITSLQYARAQVLNARNTDSVRKYYGGRIK
jgi:hypothetical protein